MAGRDHNNYPFGLINNVKISVITDSVTPSFRVIVNKFFNIFPKERIGFQSLAS
ncbi:MAG: hypothetical protein V1752_05870 [Candidatus Firestonebacteria bacterium]